MSKKYPMFEINLNKSRGQRYDSRNNHYNKIYKYRNDDEGNRIGFDSDYKKNRYSKNENNKKLKNKNSTLSTELIAESFSYIKENKETADEATEILQRICPHMDKKKEFTIFMNGKRDTDYFPMKCKICGYTMNIAPFGETEFNQLIKYLCHEFDILKLLVKNSKNDTDDLYNKITALYNELIDGVKFGYKIIKRFNKANNKKRTKSVYDYNR